MLNAPFSAESKVGAKSLELHARVIKADGTVIDYGCVSHWHRNPFVRFRRWLSQRLRSVCAPLARWINPVKEHTYE